MKIKRLDIIGFKSFVDKVSLDFQQGITAIVGPNGCGKSNVVDAIRWVMGEQSARNLRGKQMEDVIFGGSEFRKPQGMAEVSLTFSTEDGRIPAKYLAYSEIQVTRRLYRDGESEYYLNKTPCRLMDIAELFMDTGVGAKAYSIIEQGKIGMILLSKPEERRFLIEEAAGVTKFKSRKQVALKKIDVTRQNLLRLGDIISEIRRQLNSLQRQAKKAEKFRACREELKRIDLHFALREYLDIQKIRVSAEEGLAGLTVQLATRAAELEGAELALEERRIGLLEVEKTLAVAQEDIFRIKAEVQSEENRLDFQRKEFVNLERHAARFAEELAALERHLTESEAEYKLLVERSELFARELAGEEETLCTRELELEMVLATEGELVTGMERKRQEMFGFLSELAQLGNRHAAAARQLENLAERSEKSRREEVLLREKLVEARKCEGDLDEARRTLVEDKIRLTENLADLRRREEGLRRDLAEAEKSWQAHRDDLSKKESRLHSLQELEAQFEGYGQGVRSLFLTDGFRERFRGIVADLLETEEQYETALETALGERLQFIVGDSESDAVAGISRLKEISGGRCSFLIGAPALSGDDKGPDGTEKLIDHVVIRDDLRMRVEPLLVGFRIADDLEKAIMLARRFPWLTFVTLAGDMVQAESIISGGSSDGAHQGLIHKKREIKELAGQVALLSQEVARLENEKNGLREELTSVDGALREVTPQLHRGDIQLVNLEKDLQRIREEGQRIADRFSVKEMEDEQIREERENLVQEMAALESNRQAAEARKRTLEEEIEGLQETLAAKKMSIDLAREVVTTVKVRVAALTEKRGSNERAIKRVEALVADLTERIAGHRVEVDKTGAERERLVSAISQAESGLKTLVQKELAAEAECASVRQRCEGETVKVREEEARVKVLRSDVEELRRTEADHTLRLSEAVMKLRHMEGVLQDKYRLDLNALEPFSEPCDDNEPLLRERQAELQQLISEMGEVNLTAIDEYQELESRYTFLSGQQKDLEESLLSLQKAIQRINRTTRKRFLETFHLVNAKFQEVFPRLFCGGRAELRLTDEEDLLESGIDIIVQPPGKKLQNVSLLSGGEKALTAVALIFSIFLIKPSPFCLLDEVDAPLDDANIGRFNDMVREMSSFSQFIVITHNRATMTVADILYGITMEEPGVSKMVSVRLN